MQTPIEYRILHTALWSAVVAAAGLMMHDGLVALEVGDVIIETVALLLFAAMIISLKNFGTYNLLRHLFPITVFLLINAAWIVNAGMGIGIGLLFLTAIVYLQILVKERYRMLLTTGYTANIIVLFLIEFLHPGFYVVSTYGAEEPLVTKAIFVFIAYSITSWVVVYLKREYDRAYRKSTKQANELTKKNRKIQSINDDLLSLISERTNSLKENQKKLLEYAFMNSHSIRAPLTNLLSIHEALKIETLEEKERQELMEKLETESHRLDQKIKKMQKLLQQESYSDEYHNSAYQNPSEN